MDVYLEGSIWVSYGWCLTISYKVIIIDTCCVVYGEQTFPLMFDAVNVPILLFPLLLEFDKCLNQVKKFDQLTAGFKWKVNVACLQQLKVMLPKFRVVKGIIFHPIP